MTGSSWSLRLGRLAGIDVRVHLLFLIYVASEFLGALPKGVDELTWVLVGQGILVLSVLLHEFGHCFAARWVGGHPESVLLWPLGGLAFVDHPHTPRASLIVSAGGPVVNLAIATIAGVALFVQNDFPGWLPMGPVSGWLGWAFKLNYWMLLFNLLPAFPLDGGGILRAVLWPRWGFDRATTIAVNAGRVAAILVGIYGLAYTDLLMVGIALFMYVQCEQERLLLAERQFDNYGMSFDLGTSNWNSGESEPEPAVRRRKTTFFERLSHWRRRGKPSPPEELTEPEIRRRVDDLLDKIHRRGMDALTAEEREFLREASQYYK